MFLQSGILIVSSKKSGTRELPQCKSPRSTPKNRLAKRPFDLSDSEHSGKLYKFTPMCEINANQLFAQKQQFFGVGVSKLGCRSERL